MEHMPTLTPGQPPERIAHGLGSLVLLLQAPIVDPRTPAQTSTHSGGRVSGPAQARAVSARLAPVRRLQEGRLLEVVGENVGTAKPQAIG